MKGFACALRFQQSDESLVYAYSKALFLCVFYLFKEMREGTTLFYIISYCEAKPYQKYKKFDRLHN